MRKITSSILRVLTYLSIVLTVGMMAVIVVYIFAGGLGHITPQLLFGDYSSDNPSMKFAIITTIVLVLVSLIIAVPIGVVCAIYLTEYAKKGSKLFKIIRITTETLQGIPSIIFGLFGLLFFSTALHWGYSLLAGAMTLVIMILPLIIRTTEEALMGVPDAYREASFGLGAGKLRTVFKVVLPSAIPGILSGVVLATGRIVGETAALIYTAGSVAKVPSNLMGSGRTLAVHMYVLSSEGLYMDQAYATAVILLIFVLVLNWVSGFCAKHLSKATNGQ